MVSKPTQYSMLTRHFVENINFGMTVEFTQALDRRYPL